MGYKPIKQIHKISYGWARQLSPFTKQIQSPPEAVIKSFEAALASEDSPVTPHKKFTV